MTDNAGLDIVSVQVAPPVLRGDVDFGTGTQGRWIDITVTVVNNSQDALFCMASKRRFDYDSTRSLLHLWLTEPERPQVDIVITRRIFLPDFHRVEAGATDTIVVSVPAVYQQMTGITDQGVQVVEVDLTGMTSVECTVGFNPEAFQPPPDASTDEILDALRAWAHTVTQTFPASTSPSA